MRHHPEGQDGEEAVAKGVDPPDALNGDQVPELFPARNMVGASQMKAIGLQWLPPPGPSEPFFGMLDAFKNPGDPAGFLAAFHGHGMRWEWMAGSGAKEDYETRPRCRPLGRSGSAVAFRREAIEAGGGVELLADDFDGVTAELRGLGQKPGAGFFRERFEVDGWQEQIHAP
ncbi:MAG: hypothetical protein RLZ97_1905 [Verrucomicrobiota bacterium]